MLLENTNHIYVIPKRTNQIKVWTLSSKKIKTWTPHNGFYSSNQPNKHSMLNSTLIYNLIHFYIMSP